MGVYYNAEPSDCKGKVLALHPTPYTLQPTPYTLHPIPYTLHPTPCTLRATTTPYTLHFTPYTVNPTIYTLQVYTGEFSDGVCHGKGRQVLADKKPPPRRTLQ